MKKFLKWFLIILAFLVVLGYAFSRYMRYSTKQHSPEMVVQYAEKELEISVFYNRPYKKGRDIFGGLVPYGEVWRTGANEATTFTTNKDLLIGGQNLAAGTYTLWTIPERNEWEVIFNSKEYSWGIGMKGKAMREPEHDALNIRVKPKQLNREVEQFTIVFEEGKPIEMDLRWDDTEVSVPIIPKD